MPDDLKTLQQRIDEAKSRMDNEKQDYSDASGASQAMRVGVELVAGVAVGSIIGYFIDRWLGTTPWFFIVCFFLGAGAGFRNILREAKGQSGKKR